MLVALVAAAQGATLPVALTVALERVDPYTLTWARCAFAALGVGLWLGFRGELGSYVRLDRRAWGLLALAAVMLTGNFVLYLLGLGLMTPATTQVLFQAAPLLMAIG